MLFRDSGSDANRNRKSTIAEFVPQSQSAQPLFVFCDADVGDIGVSASSCLDFWKSEEVGVLSWRTILVEIWDLCPALCPETFALPAQARGSLLGIFLPIRGSGQEAIRASGLRLERGIWYQGRTECLHYDIITTEVKQRSAYFGPYMCI